MRQNSLKQMQKTPQILTFLVPFFFILQVGVAELYPDVPVGP